MVPWGDHGRPGPADRLIGTMPFTGTTLVLIDFETAQVHQLEVDAVRVAVLLALDFGRVGAERLEQRAVRAG